MTKVKEETAAQKHNFQRRAMNRDALKTLTRALVEDVIQPKIDALFVDYQKEAVEAIKSALELNVEEYNTYVKPAIRPIQKRLRNTHYNDDMVQNVSQISVTGYEKGSDYKTLKEFGCFQIRGVAEYATRNKLESWGFNSTCDLKTNTAGFDVSALKIPASMPVLMKTQLHRDFNYLLNVDFNQELYEKLTPYRKQYQVLLKEAVDLCSEFHAIVFALKKPEEIYLTLPNSLPYLPKEVPKKPVSSNALIASGEAERLNNLLNSKAA